MRARGTCRLVDGRPEGQGADARDNGSRAQRRGTHDCPARASLSAQIRSARSFKNSGGPSAEKDSERSACPRRTNCGANCLATPTPTRASTGEAACSAARGVSEVSAGAAQQTGDEDCVVPPLGAHWSAQHAASTQTAPATATGGPTTRMASSMAAMRKREVTKPV